MLLSQFGGLDFPKNPESVTEEWLEQYAKYLFSDYIGPEPENGRLNLLKRMFEAIGSERIYIITANPFAGKNYTLATGRVMNPNPYLFVFVGLLRVLLPSFVPEHLVCTVGLHKSAAIRSILESLESRPKGGARRTRSKARKTRRTRSKARRTKSKAKRTNRCSRNKS